MGHDQVVDGMYRDGFHCPMADQLMGRTAETLAERYAISREAQDAFAVDSQAKAARAWDDGAFADEIVPIAIDGKKGPTLFATDEHRKPETTAASLSKLKPVFKDGGTVHAGNASGVTDGAAACVVASASAVEKHGLVPLAEVSAWATAGVPPEVMGIGPVPSTRKLLERTGLSLNDLDLVELNEAFAAQVLACTAELPIDADRLNVHGGAIALGHPIGATGCRIATTLVYAMRRRGARTGLASLCISGGMGLSVLFRAA
jgi:acetyl-CoA C-acetyltransferase